ncbi:MutS protein-like protein 4 [Hypsibius exemplaris]|uniref:MutS protein-like protein 4 n=1 Tax=Hypsibius exemplaris TaxID=2072580 RepID=A0A9X6NIX8_HYPEX|nr:MutS protein-like protein 4 [Hypsibius exemplaris]
MDRPPSNHWDRMSLPNFSRSAADGYFKQPQSLAQEIGQMPSQSMSRGSLSSQTSLSSEIAQAMAYESSQQPSLEGSVRNGECSSDLRPELESGSFRDGGRSTAFGRPLQSSLNANVNYHGATTSIVGSKAAHPVFSHVTRTSDPRGQPGVIVALAEGRGNAHGEVGLASIDLRTSRVSLGQYADTASYTKTVCKINVLEPAMVLIPDTMTSAQRPQPIFMVLKQLNSQGGPNIVTIQRKFYNEATGCDYVKNLSLNNNGKLETELASKYYCLAAFAALVAYVEQERKVIMVNKTLRIDYMQLEDTCLIDCSTAKSLELISNANDPRQVKQCLFGVLDQTKTYAGSRLLRANLLQPYVKVETITTRYDCISEMIQTEDLFFGLQKLLSRFADVEKAITFLVQVPSKENSKVSESHIGSIIHLKHILSLVEPLRDFMKSSQNDLFRGFYDILNDERFEAMAETIGCLVHPETKLEKGSLRMKTNKCYAVKPRINGCLDVARLLYSESVDDISALVIKLQERHGLPIQTGYDASRGFHMQLFAGGKKPIAVSDLPKEFIHVTKSRNTIYFTTKDLINLNGRSLECIREVFVLSHEMLKRACEELRPLIGCLYALAECVATVDVLVSLTAACSLGDYVRPQLNEMLVLERSRHPILDRLLPEPPIANNAYADEGCNFVIITGPNMAGKTSYVKQIALLQIMAQIGSFVPAEYACFRIHKQISSRFGSGDDIQSNASSFMMEMRDMQHVCANSNSDTLVLIDELGRGTSPEEGVGICWALCEELLLAKATTFFVTHFEEICDLQHLYPGVSNLHFRTVTRNTDDNVVEVLSILTNWPRRSGSDISPPAIIGEAAQMLTKIRQARFVRNADSSKKTLWHFKFRLLLCVFSIRHWGKMKPTFSDSKLTAASPATGAIGDPERHVLRRQPKSQLLLEIREDYIASLADLQESLLMGNDELTGGDRRPDGDATPRKTAAGQSEERAGSGGLVSGAGDVDEVVPDRHPVVACSWDNDRLAVGREVLPGISKSLV